MQGEQPLEEDHFKSLLEISEGLYKEKGSKFLAFAFPVSSMEEVQQALEEIRSKYHDARHHCYAYRIDPEQPKYRANDDGEPSNSAGMPIYHQIQSLEFWNVLIVVVRYFGGVKLGVGGLIGAYKTAARTALENGTPKQCYIFKRLEIRFPYADMNEVMRVLKTDDVKIVEERMSETAGYLLEIRKNKFDRIKKQLTELHRLEIVYF